MPFIEKDKKNGTYIGPEIHCQSLSRILAIKLRAGLRKCMQGMLTRVKSCDASG